MSSWAPARWGSRHAGAPARLTKTEKRPVERSQPEPARHTGRFEGGNHPLLIDHPVLPFVRSKSSPVRACALAGDSLCRRLQPRSPGSATPTASCLDPVARFVLPRPVVVCTPVTRSTPFRQHHLRRSPVARFRLRWQRMIPHRPRFRLVNPVGSRSRHLPERKHCSLEAVPRAPVGVRLPVRRPLCSPCFARSSCIFQFTGLSTTSPRHPQNFLVRPPFMHRVMHSFMHNAVHSAAPISPRLVDDRRSTRHNHRHDVADRHRSRLHHQHSIAHVDHPRAPAAVLRGGCFISRILHHSDTRSDRTSV